MKLLFTLKKLMDDKYGVDRFAIACEIVGRWVRFETKNKDHDSTFIYKMATARVGDDFALTIDVAKALKRLFGLDSRVDLFNTFENETI